METRWVHADIVEQSIKTDCINVVYPELQGLPNADVQQKAYELILSKVYAIMPGQQCKTGKDQVMGTYKITLNKKNLFSATFENESFFFPMAHPANEMTSLTVDLKTGEVYNLVDLFKAGSHYRILINNFIKKAIEEQEIDTIAPYPGITDFHEYYLTQNTLVVFFPMYEFTPRPVGVPEFSIPFTYIRNRINPQGPLARLIKS